MENEKTRRCVQNEIDNSIKFGKLLANAPPGEEIVISGLSGAFPESDNVEEFMENLYNKRDMVSGEIERRKHFHPEVPKRLGMLKTIDKFDGGYFGIHPRQLESLSPYAKMSLEKAIEAIMDAGVNPADLEGTNTGVFVGTCYCESEVTWYFDRLIPQYYGILGNERSIVADRIAYFLKLKGVSIVMDTACNSSMTAFHHAYRLGALSKDDYCRVFDEKGTGYIRSEASVAMFLQRAKDSNRIYARVVHAKSNSDGFKEQGITHPNGSVQKILLEEVYQECGVNPVDLSYLEAHGTGTIVGDPEEMNCADEFFAKKRKTPLLVGSVKSNIGHSEPASGLCSISKVIITMETGIIPPNINIDVPRSNIPAFHENRLKIVTENTPLEDDRGLIGVNSFGFGGSNTHVLLQWNTKSKQNLGKPLDDLPRLVCVSGRTQNAVNLLLNDVVKKFDVEHVRLVQNIFRGYTIVSKKEEIKRSILPSPNNQRSVYLYFGKFTKDAMKMALKLLGLPILKNFENRLKTYLLKRNINAEILIENSILSDCNKTLLMFITQAAIAEIIKELEIKPKIIYSKSFGNFATAYFKNEISLEKYIDYAVIEANLVESKDSNNNAVKENEFSRYANKLTKEFKKLIAVEHENHSNKISDTKNSTGKAVHELEFQNGVDYYQNDDVYKTVKNENSTKNGKRTENEPNKEQNIFISLPKNAVLLEYGQSLPLPQKKDCDTVSFDFSKGLNGILETIGRLYELGFNPQIHKLYPTVEFPVSRGTPMISPKIAWKHCRTYFVPNEFGNQELSSIKNVNRFNLSSVLPDWDYLTGHCIDGRDLFPAAGYLYLAWLTLRKVRNIDISQLKVTFENCKFTRACTTPKLRSQGGLELKIMYSRLSGKFEITEGDAPVVTGIMKMSNKEEDLEFSPSFQQKNEMLLNRKDIYKELRLRGYHYKGLFRGLIQSNKTGTEGKIEWFNNWVAFLDHMLQIKILGEDTRLLYVPISISKLTIDPIKQNEMVEKLRTNKEKNPELPVYVNIDSHSIRCAGVTIQGLHASSIARRKYARVPVLEKYEFVPNEAHLTLEPSLRVILQIALENNCGMNVKIAELIDEATRDPSEALSPIMQKILDDQPLIHSDITVLGSEKSDLDFKVEDKPLATQSECTFVVGTNFLSRPKVLEEALKVTIEEGYIISREPLESHVDMEMDYPNLTLLNVYKNSNERLLFAKKMIKKKSKEIINIQISDKDKEFTWLLRVQEAIKLNSKVLLYSQNEPLNGIVGLVNCIRREPGCENVKVVFIMDDMVSFNPKLPFFQKQLKKNMAVNVLKNGKWGTYRHLLLSELNKVEIEHAYAASTARGDLSSIKWIEGPLSLKTNSISKGTLVKVHFSSLNFRDVMTASGKINADIITLDRREQECVQGFEFSGKTLCGRRVMGIISQGALSTLIRADEILLWDVPESWSLEEAATVPIVYGTCLYALVVVGQIKKGESVLIHSGTGGIGQAAINLCLYMGCTIFTTVGTQEKREYITRNFPQITEKHIGNSRDLSFQQQVLKETNGRGVDIVLNSLAEDKLFASLNCLARGGRFLEIGKFDLANDNQMSLWAFRKGASYHGVMLDRFFNEPTQIKTMLKDLVQSYIDLGAVKPLKTNVFKREEIEQAFRFMTSGKHMGKVLIKIRNQETDDGDIKFSAIPRFNCDPDRSYIICGGLGGFGLELADWLILRGAKNLVLTSRKGISTGYQDYRISIWRSYGCKINIFIQEITSKSICEELIKTANSLAPVEGVFNLAVILQDAILENQKPEMFKVSFGPKAYSTQILDEVTRTLCPELKEFVVFSSISCGRGNAGQSNYGMSNSVMERICEKRRSEGLPALAIEWGAIGEVGLVAELQEEHNELTIGGTLQQSISNCLQCMDVLIRQKESAIVSSIVVAEKKIMLSSNNVLDVVARILGINDLKSVSKQATLPELGMDSMNAVEIKQALERDFGIFLSPVEIRNLTFARLEELQQSEKVSTKLSTEQSQADQANLDLYNLLTIFTDDRIKPVVKLDSRSEEGPTLLALPGFEGIANEIQNLAKQIDAKVYCLQYDGFGQIDNIEDIAKAIFPEVKTILQNLNPFHILAHSAGGVIAIELLKLLENEGRVGHLTCVDGSPDYIKSLAINSLPKTDDITKTLTYLENFIIAGCIRLKLKEQETLMHMEKIMNLRNIDEKAAYIQNILKEESMVGEAIKSTFLRGKASILYKPDVTNLKSKIRLCKPSIKSIKFEIEDYGLSKFTNNNVEVKVYEGDHKTILSNSKLAEDLMETLRISQ